MWYLKVAYMVESWFERGFKNSETSHRSKRQKLFLFCSIVVFLNVAQIYRTAAVMVKSVAQEVLGRCLLLQEGCGVEGSPGFAFLVIFGRLT